MSSGEKYLAAAYVVVLVAVLAYVLIISTKLARLERELRELTAIARRRAEAEEHEREAEEVPVG